jgi:cytochrome c2
MLNRSRLMTFAGWTAALAAALLAASAWTIILSNGRGDQRRQIDAATAIVGGSSKAGRQVMIQRGCGACHEIPGVPAARGKIGPSLAGFEGRTFIAGRMQNSEANLVQWIENPRAVDADTAMPTLGLSRQESIDAARYLYSGSRMQW